VRVKSGSDLLIVGKEALKVLKADVVEVVSEVKGKDLVGLEYQPALDLAVQNFEHRIIAWDAVSATDGSGAVHIAPGCGAEDFELGKKLSLKQIVPIDEAGRFTEDFEWLAGMKTDECEQIIFDRLKANGALFYTHDFTHNYPFCWRCKTNVVFKLVSGWDIKTDKVRPRLLKAVESVTWEPDFLKKSMVNWLENMGDWNISRRRFYGLPLPIYPCACGEITVIGSLEELKQKAVKWVDLPHLHRPYIDEIKIKCKCGSEAERVPEVGDCWLDAGIAPFATKGYFTDKDYFKKNFPSELVLEMKEQVRLWFYSMLFMSVVLEGKAPYEKVVGHSTVLGEDGKKKSKTDKNIKVTFDEQIEIFGADCTRYVFASSNPSNDMRFGPTMVEEARRKLIAFWNTYVFFNTYAVIDKPDIATYTPSKFGVTDVWLVARLNQYIETCTREYDDYKAHNVVAETEKFIDDLSNFYIRVNRRRFWKGESGEDKMNAYWALYQAIKAVTVVMAPITPFVCEYIWQNMVREVEKDASEFVMTAVFPKKWNYACKMSDGIIGQVEFVKEVISLGLRIRAGAQLKVKQPLRTMYIMTNAVGHGEAQTAGGKDLLLFLDIIKDEVNVKTVEIVQDEDKFNVPYLVVDFKKAGAVLKGDVQRLKDELAALSTQEMTEAANRGTFKDYPMDFFVRKLAKREEFAAETEGNVTVVLDTTMDVELVEEGSLRELIRSIQVARQNAGLDISARVKFKIAVEKDLIEVARKNIDKIKQEVLATEVEFVVGKEVKIEIRK
jgi:isoleucyl-tRNA synthetase